MNSFKKYLLLASCVTLMGTAPQAQAKISKKTAGITVAVLTILSLPYMINFLTRKPLEEDRFDVKKLLSGNLKEIATQLHYFIADKIWGWPFKDSKVKVGKNDEGKPEIKVSESQLPGGFIGNLLMYTHLINKSIAIPLALVTSGKAIQEGFVTLYELDF